MRVDLHMHTEYSVDAAQAQTPLQKAQACLDAGLEIIGITDHLEYYHRRGPSENRDVEACLRDIRAAKQTFAGKLEVLVGIEVGQIYADPSADAFLRSHALDMVIGSLHVMPNDLDIYFLILRAWTAMRSSRIISASCSGCPSMAGLMCWRISIIRCASCAMGSISPRSISTWIGWRMFCAPASRMAMRSS